MGRILKPHHALTYILFVFDEGERWLCEYFFPAGSHCPAGIVLGAIWFHGLAAFSYRLTSSETQEQSVGWGEKALRKFSSTVRKAPGYRLSPDHFQTVKRLLAPDWAQKMLCIIVPNRRTVSPEFFSWVRTRRLLSCHTCPVRSPSFPNQKRRNYRWVEKRFGCYQQEQFNLHWENSVSDGSQCIVNNKKFNLTTQINNFARASRFVVHFFAVTAGLPRENA